MSLKPLYIVLQTIQYLLNLGIKCYLLNTYTKVCSPVDKLLGSQSQDNTRDPNPENKALYLLLFQSTQLIK